MKVTYQTFSDKEDYQSLLVINADDRWKETLYFTYYTPWGEEGEKLYAGRYMSDVHFRNKDCRCVLVFDFHRWSEDTIAQAIAMELPPLAFETPLEELLKQALEQRGDGDGFTMSVKEKVKPA